MKRMMNVWTLSIATLLVCFAPGIANAQKMDKKVTIVYYHNSSQGRQPEDKDDILKILNKKFNMDLKINVITSEYTSKLNLEVSSGNTPDMMQVTASEFKGLLNQGVLLPIEDYLAKMPNVLLRYPDILTDKTLRVDGHLYFLAGHQPNEKIVKSYSSLWVRKDWLDKLGLSVPKTLEEFKSVAVAFTKKDPDGNGINDTFGFSGMGAEPDAALNYPLNPILGAFGTGGSTFILDKGKLVFCPATEQYEKGLKWMADFIASGAVDPDIMLIKSYDQLREKVYRNQVGMIYMSWAEFVKPPYDKIMKDMTPKAEWIQINPPKGPNGVSNDAVYRIAGYMSSGRVLSADLADDPVKLDRIIKYLDYIAAGEGLDLVCYGVEGVHYNKVGTKIVPTEKMAEVSYAWQHQLMGRDERVYLYTKFPGCAEQITFAANLPRIDSYENFVTIPENMNKADLYRYVTEESVRFLYGKRSFDTFDDFVNTLYKTYGIQQYLDLGTKNMKNAGLLK
ncbi:MAG TPA: extracellular solute-binding protein [Rectinemataceae bacterium]|nr:extracellular solute-binding protein [Rectinemataceae bacterium]